MVESAQVPAEVSYEVTFEMKKHFTPSELTGNDSFFILQNSNTHSSFMMLIKMEQ